MKNKVTKAEEKIICYIKENAKYVGVSFFVGILVYFMLMALDLVNDVDGLWHPSNFIAGDWEISLGRGLQRYADRARFGIVSTPFNSMLTLLLISCSNVLAINLFDTKNKLQKYLMLIILVANPLVLNSLTYSYMSVNFGLAYFFSVLAAVCISKVCDENKKFIFSIVAGGVFLGISMAFYQAYICVTSIILLFLTSKMLIEKSNIESIIKYIISAVGSIFLGGVRI